MRIGLGVALGKMFGGSSSAFSVSLTGLTGGYAIIGDHASIGYTITPDNGTDTVKWSSSSDPAAAATYGTGASPTDYTAGDGNPLYCHVTDGGETVTASATIAKTQATGGVDLDLSFPEDSAISSTDLLANWTTNSNTLTLVSVSPSLPTGLSVNSSGTMTGTPTDTTADATYTITMQDAYGRQTADTFTLEITAVAAAPTLDSVTYTDNNDGTPAELAITYTGDVTGYRVYMATGDSTFDSDVPTDSELYNETGAVSGVLEYANFAVGTNIDITGLTSTSNSATRVAVRLIKSADGSGTSNAVVETVSGLDFTSPTFSSAEVGNIDADTLEITASETLLGTVDHTDFTLTGNTITAAALSSGKIRLTLGTTATSGDDYTGDLSYDGTGSALVDGDGNALTTFTNQNVTNNVAGATAPSIVDTTASGVDSDSATSVTVSGYTHGAGSNRKVIVVAGGFINPITGITLSATYGGTSMEEIASVQTGTFERFSMFQILEANLPGGGSGDVVVTASSTVDDLAAAVFTIKDAEQVALASMDTPTTVGSASGSITPSAANSLVIGFGHGSISSSAANWSAGLTRYAIDIAPGAGALPYAGAGDTSTILIGQAEQGASSLTCTHDMSSGRPGLILAAFQPA